MNSLQKILSLTFAGCGLCLGLLPDAHAREGRERNEQVVAGLPLSERENIRQMAMMRPGALEAIAETMSTEELQREARAIYELGPHGLGTRPLDEDDRAPIHRYLRERLGNLEEQGVEILGSFRGRTTVPVKADGKDPVLEAGDRRFELQTVYPNSTMPSLVPSDGLEGHLVNVGDASWPELKGKDLEGAICLMNFRGARKWERLYSLGAKAVIVLEDAFVKRGFAERLFANTPVPFPRYYANAETAARLRALAEAEESDARLLGGDLLERRPYESIFGYLPPTDPLTIRVTETSLLEFVASEAGISLDELVELNPDFDDGTEPGTRIRLPGGAFYTVTEGDLLQRYSGRYGVRADRIVAANGLESGEIRPGTELTIPNLPQPLVAVTRIDSLSVVPHGEHGGLMAANLAIALRSLEHFARSENLLRRRGFLVAFIDGDLHGGVTSRGLTEFFLRDEGAFKGGFYEDTGERLGRYIEVSAWMENPEKEEIDDETVTWFIDDWLTVVVEKFRVETAEKRVEFIKERLRTEDPAREEELQRKIDREQAMIDAIARLRDTTILNESLPVRERVQAFLSDPLLRDGEVEGLAFPIRRTALLARFAEERRELAKDQADTRSNEELVAALKEVLGEKNRFAPGYYFDFSDGSKTSGLKTNTGKAVFRQGPGFKVDYLDNLSNRLRSTTTMAAVTAGWPEAFSFYSPRDTIDFSVQSYEAVPYYPEFWRTNGISLLPLGTLNDPLARLDTPRDTVEALDFDNLSVQGRTALLILAAGVESAIDSATPQRQSRSEIRSYGLLTGRAVQFNIRSGIDAQEPVPGTLIYYPACLKANPSAVGGTGSFNSATKRGARVGVLQTTLLDGSYTLPLESVTYATAKGHSVVYGFYLDREEALVRKIVNQGLVGTQKRTADFSLLAGEIAKKDLVLTDVYPRVFFPGSDPMDYNTVGGGTTDTISVTDAVLSGEPLHYGVLNPKQDYKEIDIDSNLLFMREGRRARVAVQAGPEYKMILPGEVTDEHPKGRGFLVGPAEGGRNLTVPHTALEIARSMLDLSQRRKELYERFGIRDQAVNRALIRSEEKLQEAEKALAEKHWQAATGAARESWGMLVKLYPDLLALGRQAVFSVIILMALLVPGAVFLEKLTIGAKSIMGHLGGAVGIFVAAAFFLRAFHPAFKISVSPFIVIISFTMILMSVIVLALSYQRFEVLLRRARASGGEVEGEEATLMSSLGTALSLGISNLKKRPSRTFLTALTVTVLTFSIVAFVSVSGEASVDRKPVQVDDDIEGEKVDAHAPRYEGVLFRNYFWHGLESNFITALETEFGTHYELTRRGYYIEVEGGNNADREGTNQIAVTRDGKTSIITGIMTFEPNEPEFSALHETVSGGEWFRPTGEDASKRLQVILPDNVASKLGITPEMIHREDGSLRPWKQLPEVDMKTFRWKVIGIMDTAEADRYRDINGKSLAMVDYLRSAYSSNIGGELINEPDGYHKSWEDFVAIPRAAEQDVGGKPRSVAIQLPPDADSDQFYEDIAMRLDRTFFGHLDGDLALVTTKKKLSLGGLAKIVVPVILCILIVTNTMLGAVEERRGEVGMLGAIGLSPTQISFLLLSESTVFSIIGVVFGIFGGLAFANMVPFIAANFGGLLGGLSFNFTSLLSMGLAMATGLVVLVATLIPAQKAAALAAPSGMARWSLPEPTESGEIHFELPFTLTRGNAVGMLAFFRQFLGNHTDATSSDFNCRDIEVHLREEGTRLELTADMWLTPYDLDVAQHFTLAMKPGESAGVSVVELVLVRFSGTEEAWLRTNYGFLDLVRRQFLLWRNMTPEVRSTYIEKGRGVLDAAATTPLER